MNKSIYYAQWGKSENWKNTYLVVVCIIISSMLKFTCNNAKKWENMPRLYNSDWVKQVYKTTKSYFILQNWTLGFVFSEFLYILIMNGFCLYTVQYKPLYGKISKYNFFLNMIVSTKSSGYSILFYGPT